MITLAVCKLDVNIGFVSGKRPSAIKADEVLVDVFEKSLSDDAARDAQSLNLPPAEGLLVRLYRDTTKALRDHPEGPLSVVQPEVLETPTF
ncbi:hypothetical protein ABT061_27890 [Streptosporangium sp. NPDC002544]|uniref:hypothetical protein n=1 Tax=Streptosporangium sp. NPDC002544 TaxID=3154538 RepID=UPI00332FDAB3